MAAAVLTCAELCVYYASPAVILFVRLFCMRDRVSPPSPPAWTFLSNHGHVLLCLAGQPGIRLRDVAAQVHITERAVQRIVADLEQAGYLRHRRCGRRNNYEFRSGIHLRHPVEEHRTVGELIGFVFGPMATGLLCQEHLSAIKYTHGTKSIKSGENSGKTGSRSQTGFKKRLNKNRLPKH